MSDPEKASFYERLKKGLEDGIAYSRGELTLRTTTRPAPPPPVSARNVRKLRTKLGMSQSVFAALLNISPKLVQSWEQGLRKPDRGALRLLQIVQKHPELVDEMFGNPSTNRARPKRAVA
jgi:putative transcriptional regulator